ncbi:MAG: hypothetical protein HRT88_03935 [Lentisphaeraceae bacterium]|nr:hypothetical protein [Lentisphaeraceae bacterium]
MSTVKVLIVGSGQNVAVDCGQDARAPGIVSGDNDGLVDVWAISVWSI